VQGNDIFYRGIIAKSGVVVGLKRFGAQVTPLVPTNGFADPIHRIRKIPSSQWLHYFVFSSFREPFGGTFNLAPRTSGGNDAATSAAKRSSSRLARPRKRAYSESVDRILLATDTTVPGVVATLQIISHRQAYPACRSPNKDEFPFTGPRRISPHQLCAPGPRETRLTYRPGFYLSPMFCARAQIRRKSAPSRGYQQSVVNRGRISAKLIALHPAIILSVRPETPKMPGDKFAFEESA